MKPLSAAGAALTAAVLFAAPAFAQSRDQIRIVGSSTVFPYTQAVAEQFAGMTGTRRRWSSRPAPAAACRSSAAASAPTSPTSPAPRAR